MSSYKFPETEELREILLKMQFGGGGAFPHTQRCPEDRSELSVVLLCIITLGLLLNTVYLYDSDWQESAEMCFPFGIFSFLLVYLLYPNLLQA